jgi:hypothetical protein
MAQVPVRIGTAGWSVLSRYAEEFPPGGSHLERYARRLNAAEINSSFHRPHQRTTYERWAQSTPLTFRFSVKVPKTITHEQRLIGSGALLDRFLAEATGLGDKLGVLLVQLPGKFAFEEKAADQFFSDLRARIDVPKLVHAGRQRVARGTSHRTCCRRSGARGRSSRTGRVGWSRLLSLARLAAHLLFQLRCGGACVALGTHQRAPRTRHTNVVRLRQHCLRRSAWQCARADEGGLIRRYSAASDGAKP